MATRATEQAAPVRSPTKLEGTTKAPNPTTPHWRWAHSGAREAPYYGRATPRRAGRHRQQEPKTRQQDLQQHPRAKTHRYDASRGAAVVNTYPAHGITGSWPGALGWRVVPALEGAQLRTTRTLLQAAVQPATVGSGEAMGIGMGRGG